MKKYRNFWNQTFIISRLNPVVVLGFLLTFLSALPAGAEYRVQADANWKVIDLQNLAVKPGTALDFSFLVGKGDAGQYGFLKINDKGQFAFEKCPDMPVRFFVASQIPRIDKFTGLPEFGDWDKQAEQIRLNGYNAVRPHFLDEFLMSGSTQESVFNQAQVDKWERYVAALKKNGIYLIMDASTSWIGYSAVKDRGSKEGKAVRFKSRLTYDESARAMYRKAVTQLFTKVNPYTNTALKDDPQMAWITLRNESSMNFLRPAIPGGTFSDPDVSKPFRTWLKKRYTSREDWATAWGTDLKPETTFDNVVLPLPKQKGPASVDLQRFYTDIERETYSWGLNLLHSLGVKVPIIDYNNCTAIQTIIARDVLPFVDNHVYSDGLSGDMEPGTKIINYDALSKMMNDFRWISSTRMLGRPFSVSEWGGIFWNSYRHNHGISFAGYFAFQNGQVLAQHATPVAPSLGNPEDTNRKGYKITIYGIWRDPAARANERMAAFVFARGDVAPSPHHVELKFDANTIYDTMSVENTVSESLTPLALLAGYGACVVGDKNSAPKALYTPDMVIIPTGSAEIKIEGGNEVAGIDKSGNNLKSMVDTLRNKGVLDKQNRTDVAKKIFESDTRELYLDADKCRFSVNTPRSQGVAMPAGPCSMSTSELVVDNQGDCMTLMLASLSNDPITSSKRLLLIVSGDALNSNMIFQDESKKVLVDAGRGPALARVLNVKIQARLAPVLWEVWALDQTGTRKEKVPAEFNNGTLSIGISTGSLKNGPTPYFEIFSSGK